MASHVSVNACWQPWVRTEPCARDSKKSGAVDGRLAHIRKQFSFMPISAETVGRGRLNWEGKVQASRILERQVELLR